MFICCLLLFIFGVFCETECLFILMFNFDLSLYDYNKLCEVFLILHNA